MKNLFFSKNLLTWYEQFGRKNLPWQNPRDAYTTWLSEIMLQQTQVQTVVPYFQKFIQTFPNLETLAHAKEDAVMALWAGLGYYSRVRNLMNTARIIYFKHEGLWPEEVNELTQLPGIGRSTAAAIVSQAFNKPAPILDGNVIRVLSRYFMVEGFKEDVKTKKELWQLACDCMPEDRFDDYTQAIMDLGALCCTPKNPRCAHCPLNTMCLAFKNMSIEHYPQRKTRKTLPTKTRYFIVIQNQKKQIYLQKNPPSGIWGSLWNLPSVEHVNTLTHWLSLHEMDPLTQPDELPVIKHSFTHFHLMLHPYLFKVTSPQPNATNWYSMEDMQQVGLPAPVRKIIQGLL